MTCLLKKESWKAALGLTEKRAKGSLVDKKAPWIKKKELLTLTLGDDADGRNEGNDDDDGWEPVEPIASPCDSVLVYWGFSAKKSV
jgi:hypothetical protein